MAVGGAGCRRCALRDARDDVFEDRCCCGGYGGVVAWRAGVIAPYLRLRTAME